MRKRYTLAVIAPLLLIILIGCSANPASTVTLPQMQAAVDNDRASIALNVFCKQEIAFKADIDPTVHKTIQQKCLQLATLDQQITASIQANNLTGAQENLAVAVTLGSGLSTDLLNIKDPTTQQAMQIAQTLDC